MALFFLQIVTSLNYYWDLPNSCLFILVYIYVTIEIKGNIWHPLLLDVLGSCYMGTYIIIFICSFFYRRGLTDDLGSEALMIDALDKVEKDLKKPLLRNDKKGMDLLLAEFDKINKK